MKARPFFPAEEFQQRREAARQNMQTHGLDAVLVSCPENVFYLTGLDHQGYFAYEMLVLPLEGEPILITRAMEAATVRDQTPDVKHVGYSDGLEPLPPPADRQEDLVMATADEKGEMVGIKPWSMSYGIETANSARIGSRVKVPIKATCDVLRDAGLARKVIGMEMNSSFLPYAIARGVIEGMPDAKWTDAAGLVDECRLVQSPRELQCTREAAALSDSMMLAAIAAAGIGVHTREIMAAVYDAMFRRGGTYPGFIPLVRSTQTLSHEHGTWRAGTLSTKDILFLEMAGCMRRYHAPIGRLVFVGKAPARTNDMHKVCLEAMERAATAIRPGVEAKDVYRAWQSRLDKAGLASYRRHHCGYAVGIGFPPSWSGSGTPVGLRADSRMELKPGMVFHLMSWLLRTGRGDSFFSDTIVVTEHGCEFLTTADRSLCVRA